jgi:ribosome biogenesis protein UTP30
MKLDFEPTINHWNELLKKLEIDFITRVIPFNQLKKDYKPFEMKAKLAKQFDRFLVDGRISGNVFHFLGSQFTKRKKNPVSVKLQNEENIKLNLKKVLSKVQYKQVNSGPTVEIPFGIYKMDEALLVDNVMDLIEKLKTILPGGWLNIKKLMIKPMTPCKIVLPIYVSKGKWGKILTYFKHFINVFFIFQ